MNQTINPARRRQTFRSFLEHKRTIATLASSTIILLIAPLLPASWAMISAYLISYLLVSYDVLWQSVQNIRHGELFDENFLMAIATIGALLLGDYPEAVAVMLFYQVGDLFEDVAVNRSKQSISALLAVKATTATIKTATGTQTVAPEAVTPGQLLIIKPGERVPLDGELRTGTTSLDTSALTGESLPQDVQPGDAVLSGSINLTGMIEVLVTKPYQESTIARILDLVENANQKKTTTEKFIKRFAKVYTPVVVGLAVLLAIVPPLLQVGAWATWINRALVFLVISCPCALVISVPLSFFGGIGAASRHGILIKGSNFLEALTAVKTVAFDKTGTLTQGQFTVNGVEPATDAMAATELLKLAAAVEQQSTHPIARSIVTAYTGDLSQVTVSDLTEKAGHGITATVDGQTVVVGNARAMAAHQITVPDTATTGTTIDVAVDGHYVGRITVADQPKPDAAKAISTLKHEGVTQTVLLTGDNHVIANTIGQQLGLDRVEAELLPEQKVAVMADLTQQAHPQHQKVAFVGDGINDTPVLARADVGIAMGGLGSDAAIEAADIVIMDDQPSKLAQAITIAHHTKRIVWQNIIFALVIKIGFLALGALGIAGMWEAVFADVGVTLLAVLNALRLQRL